MFSLAPPLTAVVGGYLLRERVDPVRVLALAIGLGGAILLTSTRSASGSSPHGDLLHARADFRHHRHLRDHAQPRATLQRALPERPYGAIGMLGILVIGVLGGGVAGVVRALQDPPTALMFFGEIVIGLSVYSQVAQSYALRALAAGTTSVLGSYGTLVVGLVGAVALLHERIAPTESSPALMLAVALALALVPVRRRPAAVSDPA